MSILWSLAWNTQSIRSDITSNLEVGQSLIRLSNLVKQLDLLLITILVVICLLAPDLMLQTNKTSSLTSVGFLIEWEQVCWLLGTLLVVFWLDLDHMWQISEKLSLSWIPVNKKCSHIFNMHVFVINSSWWCMYIIEDARTNRGSSHIGCKLRKWQKHHVLVYTLHTHAASSSVSYTCFEYLFTMKLTQMVEIEAL